MLALSFLGLPEHFGSDLLAAIAFGIVLVFMVSFGCRLGDYVWKHLDLEAQVHQGNLSAGLVMASLIFGLCYAMSQVIVAILG